VADDDRRHHAIVLGQFKVAKELGLAINDF
jgi:hypothetical protein